MANLSLSDFNLLQRNNHRNLTEFIKIEILAIDTNCYKNLIVDKPEATQI